MSLGISRFHSTTITKEHPHDIKIKLEQEEQEVAVMWKKHLAKTIVQIDNTEYQSHEVSSFHSINPFDQIAAIAVAWLAAAAVTAHLNLADRADRCCCGNQERSRWRSRGQISGVQRPGASLSGSLVNKTLDCGVRWCGFESRREPTIFFLCSRRLAVGEVIIIGAPHRWVGALFGALAYLSEDDVIVFCATKKVSYLNPDTAIWLFG